MFRIGEGITAQQLPADDRSIALLELRLKLLQLFDHLCVIRLCAFRRMVAIFRTDRHDRSADRAAYVTMEAAAAQAAADLQHQVLVQAQLIGTITDHTL